MLHKEAEGVFMTWQHAKFEMLGYDGILTLALKTKNRSYAVNTLVVYILFVIFIFISFI